MAAGGIAGIEGELCDIGGCYGLPGVRGECIMGAAYV